MKISPNLNSKMISEENKLSAFLAYSMLVRWMAPGRSIASARLERKAILSSLVLSKSSETATKFFDRFKEQCLNP